MKNRLYSRRQPGGRTALLDRGVFPIGDVWWVGSAVTDCSDTAGFGRDPLKPFATLVYAETAAGTDDTIFLLPGHTETIGNTGAAAIVLDIAGLKVIGLGGRTRQPIILVDGFQDTYVSVTGADTVLENITFSAGHDDIASGIIVAADGVEIRNCAFIQNDTDENFLECITDGGANTADQLLIEGCEFFQYDTSGTAAIVMDAAQDRVIIRNNVMMGDWSATIDGTGVPTFITVAGNLITTAATDDNASIKLDGSATGIVAYNAGANQNAASGVAVTASACGKIENYFSIPSEDKNGILDPGPT